MNKMAKKFTITLNKNLLIIFVVIIVAVGLIFVFTGKGNGNGKSKINSVYESLSPQAKSLYYQQSDGLTREVDSRLVELDQLTIGCFGANKIMQMKESDPNLGGQCCGALKNADQYRIQLSIIKDFLEEHREHLGNNADLIPKDPYDVPVANAKKLTKFDNDIVLNSEQQIVYDKAVQLSHHGGPCCCKCWKWYVMSGLAKKLIVDNNVDAEFLAELWDISSSCGHDEDTNMFEHYKKDKKGVHGAHGNQEGNSDYSVQFQTNPKVIETNNPVALTFNIKDSNGKPATLEISHERILHTIIVSGDFSVFKHIHPEDFGNIKNMKESGSYSVKFNFPKAGKYIVAIDFMVDDKTIAKQFIVDASGESKLDELDLDFSRELNFDGYDIEFTLPDNIISGKEVTLNYNIEKDGEPVNDLEPYLGAPMHVAVISSDLKNFMHTHGELENSGVMREGMNHEMLPDKFGPEIKAHVTFPTKGIYFVAGEVKHDGKVIVTKFMIDVK